MHTIACDHETSGGAQCANTHTVAGTSSEALGEAAIVLARHEGWWIEDGTSFCPDHGWETIDHAEVCPICLYDRVRPREVVPGITVSPVHHRSEWTLVGYASAAEALADDPTDTPPGTAGVGE